MALAGVSAQFCWSRGFLKRVDDGFSATPTARLAEHRERSVCSAKACLSVSRSLPVAAKMPAIYLGGVHVRRQPWQLQSLSNRTTAISSRSSSCTTTSSSTSSSSRCRRLVARAGRRCQIDPEYMRQFMRHDSDHGSSVFQVALYSARIDNLTKHLQTNRKDKHNRRGLDLMVIKRNRHLKYIYRNAPERYYKICSLLDLRPKYSPEKRVGASGSTRYETTFKYRQKMTEEEKKSVREKLRKKRQSKPGVRRATAVASQRAITLPPLPKEMRDKEAAIEKN